MASINQTFFDREVSHQIFINDYKSTLANNIDEIDPNWRNTDFTQERSWRRPLSARFRRLRDLVTNGREDFLLDELNFQRSTLRSRWYKPSESSLEAFRQRINTPSINDRLLTQELSIVQRLEVQRVRSQLRAALSRGASRAQLRSIANRASGLTKQHAKAIVNTEITRASTVAKQLVAEDNPDLISGFLYTAILDSATTDICRSNHNRVVDVDEQRYVPPLHFGCRSTLVPVSHTRSQLEENGLDPPSNLETTLPIDLTLDAWFSRQPFQVQRQLLGSEEAVSFWQNGQPLNQLLTRRGTVKSQAAIRRNQSLITRLIPFARRVDDINEPIGGVTRPVHLINSPKQQANLRELYEKNSTLDLVNYRGVTLRGKRSTLLKPDEPTYDPVTGAARSNRLYDPDFQLLQQRLEFVRNSKTLSVQQREFIEKFVNDADNLGVNKQTAIIENLRVLFERYNNNPVPWENFEAVVRSELRFSVVNASRLLDRRSRKSSEYWLKFSGVEGDEPGVFIGNRFYSLDEIQRTSRSRQAELDLWRRVTAANEGRNLSSTVKGPLFTYFIGPIGLKTPRVIIRDLRKEIERLKLLPEKLSNIKSIISEYTRNQINSIIDIERNILQVKNDILIKFLRRGVSVDQDLERNLSRSVQTVAGGVQTDYDGLAITIGRDLYQDYFKNVSREPATLRTYHRAGSRVLNSLEERGIIRVNNRGTVRRSTIDLETGRAGGAWKDTISREVELVDPKYKRFAELNRIEYINRQLGFPDNRSRLTARIGEKDYYDSFGRKTNVPITTRDAYERFPANQVDSDIVNMINHANSVRYKVDPDHAEFMYRVFTFRDPRGRTEYYDSLNGFREEIIRRGQIGYGLMETLRYYQRSGRSFTNAARIDSRGRVYYQGYISPTGGEVVRPFLESTRSRVLTRDGYEAIQGTIGALLGTADEKLDYLVRLQVFEKNKASLIDLGRIMSSKTQPDRRVREFLEHPLVRQMEPEEVNKLARLALEVYRIETHTGSRPYRTTLNLEVDASASGLQMISMATRTRELAVVGNLFPLPRKRRIYDLVAQDTVNDARWVQISEQLGVDLSWEEVSKVAKYQVLLTSYGAGRGGLRARAVADISKILAKRDVDVITRPQQLSLLREVDTAIRTAERFDTPETVASLQSFRRELNEFLASGQDVSRGRALLHEARDFPEVYRFLNDFTANGKPVLTAQRINDLADLLSEKLVNYSSTPRDYIDLHKRIAERYVIETGKVDIPWLSFDNKVFVQNYRPKVDYEVRFRDPVTGHYVRNIYSRTADSSSLQGKAGVGDVRLGWAVNGTHTNDASVVRRFHLWGRNSNTDTATIHDAVFIHANDVNPSIDQLNRIYAEFTDSNHFLANLNNLRSAGLSRESYNEFLEDARRLGFLNNEFSGRDILVENPSGTFRYSWDF